LTLGVRPPRQAGELVDGMGVSCGCGGGGRELFGEHSFSVAGFDPPTKGAHGSGKAPPFPKKGLADDEVRG